MTCTRAEGLLALSIEGDLADAARFALEDHLRGCANCRELAGALEDSQALLKSLRSDRVPETALASVRRTLMPQVEELRKSAGWALRFDRFVRLGFRPRYAVSAFAVLLAVSAVLVPRLERTAGVPPLPVTDVVVPSIPESNEPVRTARIEKSTETPSVSETTPREIFVEVPSLFEPKAVPVSDLAGAGESDAADEAPKPIVVKLVTDDPNVIIYWLAETPKGGGA